jgi:hypothetical protein
MANGNSMRARAVTDSLRCQVREELPELEQISDRPLQEKAVEAWAFTLAHSSFKSIHDPTVRRFFGVGAPHGRDDLQGR